MKHIEIYNQLINQFSHYIKDIRLNNGSNSLEEQQLITHVLLEEIFSLFNKLKINTIETQLKNLNYLSKISNEIDTPQVVQDFLMQQPINEEDFSQSFIFKMIGKDGKNYYLDFNGEFYTIGLIEPFSIILNTINYNNELNELKETIKTISLKLIHENIMFKLFNSYTYDAINTIFENLEDYLTNEQKSLIIISKETKLLDITIQKMTLSGANAIVFLDDI